MSEVNFEVKRNTLSEEELQNYNIYGLDLYQLQEKYVNLANENNELTDSYNKLLSENKSLKEEQIEYTSTKNNDIIIPKSSLELATTFLLFVIIIVLIIDISIHKKKK